MSFRCEKTFGYEKTSFLFEKYDFREAIANFDSMQNPRILNLDWPSYGSIKIPKSPSPYICDDVFWTKCHETMSFNILDRHGLTEVCQGFPWVLECFRMCFQTTRSHTCSLIKHSFLIPFRLSFDWLSWGVLKSKKSQSAYVCDDRLWMVCCETMSFNSVDRQVSRKSSKVSLSFWNVSETFSDHTKSHMQFDKTLLFHTLQTLLWLAFLREYQNPKITISLHLWWCNLSKVSWDHVVWFWNASENAFRPLEITHALS